MPSHTHALFEELSNRGYDPGLRSHTATIRFEVSDAKGVDSWSVAIDKGDIVVSMPGDPKDADCTIRADRDLFERIASGETNAMAAMLRGDLLADGDPELLISSRRLLAVPTSGDKS